MQSLRISHQDFRPVGSAADARHAFLSVPAGQFRKRRRWRVVSAAIAVLAASTGLAAAADLGRALPAPTGKFAVGRVTYYWTDSSRPELHTADENDKRELRVDLWYPADPSTPAQVAPYFPDLKALNKQLGPETLLLAPITAHTLANPPIAAGNARYPTLLFSPGSGTNASQYTALVEELVSHGYVVATVDHPFQSKAIVYPDGRVVVVAPPSPEELAKIRNDPDQARQDYHDKVKVRSADLRFVLDQLRQLDAGQDANEADKKFAGRFDLERVGVVGHSIGGVAAAEACFDDPRFKAAINLDGHARSLPFFPDQNQKGPRQPLLELTDGPGRPTDQQLARQQVTREEFDRQAATVAQHVDGMMRTIAGGSLRVTIPGVRHQSFGDAAIWDPGPLPERYRRMQIIRDYSRAFFDKTLLSKDQTLLDATSGPYSEVTIERFEPSR